MNIEVGDRVTYKYININSDELESEIITDEVMQRDYQVRFDDDFWKLIKIERPNWTVVEEKKELLTEEEREYLKNVLKFESIQMKSIKKIRNSIGDIELILFFGNGPADGYYRHIKEDYFKNLKFDRIYILEELRTGGLNGRTAKGHKHR